MARRAFTRGAAAIAQKRLTSWFQFIPSNTAFAAAGGTVIFTLNAAALAMRPFTIIRSRFEIAIWSDQFAAPEIQVGALGMAVVSDQASAVGVTAVPTSITDMGSDLWFVHQLIYSNITVGSAVAFTGSDMTHRTIDSKAMRKVDIGQDLVIVGELSVVGNNFDMLVGGRMLVKVN